MYRRYTLLLAVAADWVPLQLAVCCAFSNMPSIGIISAPTVQQCVGGEYLDIAGWAKKVMQRGKSCS